MALSKADQDRLRWAALLHDIGKLRVPAKILRKPGKPTDDEWETLKQHPVDGEKLVRPLAPWLGPWTLAVEQHHERFGGGGYPRGLVGTEISLGGRIVAVADAYEVMITSRPYKRPVKPESARQELVRYSGDQFDPAVVRAFLGISIGNLRKAMGCIGLLGEVPILATAPRAGALLQEAGRHTLGVVGTAAGTGAIVAATALAPVHSPAASPPVPQGAAHATANATISDGRRGAIESSPTSPSSTPARSGEGSAVGSPSLDLTGSPTGTSVTTQPVLKVRSVLPADDLGGTTVKRVTSVVAAPQGAVPDAAAVQNALGPQGGVDSSRSADH
jgi:HD domain